MIDYRLFIAIEVLDSLRSCSKSEQTRITRLLEKLAVNPMQSGDYVEKDDVGRPIQVIVTGRHALFYWADHAVREIKVIDLKLAGS